MKSPQTFVEQYTGKAIDYDGAYGVQCVDGFEVGIAYLGIPTMPTPNNWADGFWTCLDANGRPSPSTEAWRDKYFDRIRRLADFRNGDWVIWARGSASHPSSHVAMWYEGKEFGENQGGDRSFCLKSTDFSDALGALRPKAWALIPGYDSDMTINGHLYHLYGQADGLRPVIISPGLNKTAKIQNLDVPFDVYAKITGCNCFQMRTDQPDPYGTTYGDISSPICGVYQNLPNQDSTMFFDLETGQHADCTGINIDSDHNVFSPVLIYEQGKCVQYARMVGLQQCTRPSRYSFVIRQMNGTYALGLSDQDLTPDQIWNDLRTLSCVQNVSFIDGGGSAQMMRYRVSDHKVEYIQNAEKIATAGAVAFIGREIADIIIQDEPQATQTEPTPGETGESEETPMEENKPQNQPEMSPVEGWSDPEPGSGTTIVERISALMSVKSIITLAFVGTYLAMVLQGQQVPSLFENILTMIVSFFFGYQFRKAEK